MKNIFLIPLLFLLLACGGRRESPSQVETVHKEHGSKALHLNREQIQEWGIKWALPAKTRIASRISVPGVLSLNLNRTAHISSFVGGKVVSLAADLGVAVRKGQVLLTINSPEFADAQAEFLQAQARFLLSTREFDRAKMLLKENAIEKKEYLRREAEHEQAATRYGALGSALHSYGITHAQIDELIGKCKLLEDKTYKCDIADPRLSVLSPISGTVIERDVILGEHVIPEKNLFSVSDLSTLWAILDAYENDLPLIRADSSVTITSSQYPEQVFPGKITTISDLVDPKLRTIKVRVEIDNADKRLKPNMYIQGHIENRTITEDGLLLPEAAVQNLEKKKVVFIRSGETAFTAQPVTVGGKIGGSRIILNGLIGDEDVVIEGAFTLKAELGKATFGHVHAH